jgi:hypothetical protein
MGTSSANPDSPNSNSPNSDSPSSDSGRSHNALVPAGPAGRSKDDGAPVPRFLSADSASPPVDDESDAPSLEAEVKRLQLIVARNRELRRLPNVDPEMPRTPRLCRPGFAAAGLASVITAAVIGAVLFVISSQIGDWEFADQPQLASREPSLPQASPSLTPPQAIVNSSAARQVERQVQPASQQQAMPLQAAARSENRPAEKAIEVAAAESPARSEPPVMTAEEPARHELPERPAIATQGLAPPVRSEPRLIAVQEPARPERPELPAMAEQELALPELPGRPALATQGLAPPAKFEPPVIATQEPAPPARPEPPAMPAQEPAPPAKPEPPAAAAQRPAAPAKSGLSAMAAQVPAPRARPGLPAMAAVGPAPGVRPGPPAKLAPGPGRRARPELPPDLPPISHAFPPVGVAVVRARGDFQFADSGIRYLTIGELLELPADRLLIARNEIFARKGLYFRGDALRAYFAQFPWYRPYAWEVPLSPIEQANVDLIWSFEEWRASYALPM